VSRWRNAVRAELLRYRASTDQTRVTRQTLLRQSLDALRERFPDATTPEQTLSRTLQELRDREEISFDDDDGVYEIQGLAPPFDAGETYTCVRIHDHYGGKRQAGIAPSASYPFVFLFYAAGNDYGYEDGFDGDTFVYTGEGRTSDMELTHGNKAIRDHASDGRHLYLFEMADAGEVSFVGEYAYADYFRQELPDATGDRRSALRFELRPVATDRDAQTVPDLGDEQLERLYEEATGSNRDNEGREQTRTTTTTYSRSAAVRSFIRAYADGVCEGCDEPAPFRAGDGEPYLEVDHLHRRADGGADDPSNVVALCPNCHRRRHYGRDGDSFNGNLIAYVESRPF